MRLPLRAVLFACLLALLSAAPAAADNGGLSPVTPQSPNAQAISDTYWLILGITGAIFLIVEGTLIVFIVRYRRGRRARTAEGPQIRGNTNIEIAWTLVPVLIVATIIGFVFAKLPDVNDVPSAQAGEADAIDVRVEGHQFYWLFRYPQGQVTIDTMVVPVRRTVKLTIVSSDVIHSWWVPALGGKTDAIPGRTNHTFFRADRQGTFVGQCAELCGLFHTTMRNAVRVVGRAEYQRFLAQHADSSRTVAAETFTGACEKCHGLNGSGDYGPPLQNRTFQTADMTDLLRNGRRKMPAVGNTWTHGQIQAVIAYLKATKGGASLGS